MKIWMSGFGDEISPVFEEQLAVLKDLGIGAIELRSIAHRNLLEFTDAELVPVQEALRQQGMIVSALGSPIGKSSLEEPEPVFWARFVRAVDICQRLQTRYLRVFSFYVPDDEKSASFPHVRTRFEKMVAYAANQNIVLLHENEKGIYGDTPERCLELLRSLDDSHLRLTFDPANFIQVGCKAYPNAFDLLSSYISYIHVKDAQSSDGKVTVAGSGDAQWPQMMEALERQGFEGYFSLEPHLGPRSGPGGKEAGFRRAYAAFRSLLST
ncbi:MAG: sugar phosphate isomerase/epimerase [Firmicutes bacterium]|nr:sugar phosphate isomerase/epimerase [Bacillota bacterium]MCL5972506.1 sugar phosphate isomerase/epimerase [Bacillota bacterium]